MDSEVTVVAEVTMVAEVIMITGVTMVAEVTIVTWRTSKEKFLSNSSMKHHKNLEDIFSLFIPTPRL